MPFTSCQVLLTQLRCCFVSIDGNGSSPSLILFCKKHIRRPFSRAYQKGISSFSHNEQKNNNVNDYTENYKNKIKIKGIFDMYIKQFLNNLLINRT